MPDPATLLTYEISPPRIPFGDGTSTVTLTIIARNGTEAAVACEDIRFTFPQQARPIVASSLDAARWPIRLDSTNMKFASPAGASVKPLASGEQIGFTFRGVLAPSVLGVTEIAIDETAGGESRRFGVGLHVVESALSITEFSVDKVFVWPGEKVTFGWRTLKADDVVLMLPSGPADVHDTRGTYVYEAPATSFTATLKAIAGRGRAQAQIHVTVRVPRIVRCGVELDDSGDGYAVRLAWEAQHALGCWLTVPGGRREKVDASGAWRGVAGQSGAYELEPFGPPGPDGKYLPEGKPPSSRRPPLVTKHRENVTVEPVEAGFSATPSAIEPGAPVTLQWTAKYASRRSIDCTRILMASSERTEKELDKPKVINGVTPERGTPLAIGAWGSCVVRPEVDTTYKLTVDGRDAPLLPPIDIAVFPTLRFISLQFLPSGLELVLGSEPAEVILTAEEKHRSQKVRLKSGASLKPPDFPQGTRILRPWPDGGGHDRVHIDTISVTLVGALGARCLVDIEARRSPRTRNRADGAGIVVYGPDGLNHREKGFSIQSSLFQQPRLTGASQVDNAGGGNAELRFKTAKAGPLPAGHLWECLAEIEGGSSAFVRVHANVAP